MKNIKIVFSAYLDTKFNLFLSVQITRDLSVEKKWNQLYIGFLFWEFTILFIKKQVTK